MNSDYDKGQTLDRQEVEIDLRKLGCKNYLEFLGLIFTLKTLVKSMRLGRCLILINKIWIVWVVKHKIIDV